MVTEAPITFEVFKHLKNQGKKFLKLSQTSFSGIINYN